MSANLLQLCVPVQPPFAFDLALAYLRRSPSSIVEVVADDAYRRVVRLTGPGRPRVGLLTVRAESTTPGLAVTLSGPEVSEGDRAEVAAFVRRLFSVDDDLAAFHAVVEGDPVFAEVAHRWRGLRPVLIPDLFEAIVWAIVGQQVNVHFAARCKRALVERFGERVTLDGGSYLLFPEPARLAGASEAGLAALQFSRQKIRYVLGLARDVAAGRLDLATLTSLPTDVALAKLEGLIGVGRWTAEYVLLRGLGRRDVIPAADGGLRRIIGSAYGLGRSASEAEVRRIAERWAGWRGYAAFYWWFALQARSGDDPSSRR